MLITFYQVRRIFDIDQFNGSLDNLMPLKINVRKTQAWEYLESCAQVLLFM